MSPQHHERQSTNREGLGDQLYAAKFAQEARLVELQRRLSHYSWLEPDPIVISPKTKFLQVFEVEKSWDAVVAKVSIELAQEMMNGSERLTVDEFREFAFKLPVPSMDIAWIGMTILETKLADLKRRETWLAEITAK